MDRHRTDSFFKTSTVFSRNSTVTTKYFYIAFWARMNTIRAKFFLPLHLLQKHIVLSYCSSCAFVTKYEANMQKWCMSYLWQVLSCPSTQNKLLNILLCVFQEERELFSLCLHVRIEDGSLVFQGSLSTKHFVCHIKAVAKRKRLIKPEVQSSYSKLQEDPQGHVQRIYCIPIM